MKSNNLYLSVQVTAFIAFSFLFVYKSIAADANCATCVQIEKTNWYNSMGCDYSAEPCVDLFEDHTLVFALKARYLLNDISAYPEMHFYYHFPLIEVSGHTNAITNQMLTPTTLENGVQAYEASFLITVDLTNECDIPLTTFNFPIEYHLVDQSDDPYNVEGYPDLWPNYIFVVPASGYTELYSGGKDICCDAYTGTKCGDDGSHFSLAAPNVPNIGSSTEFRFSSNSLGNEKKQPKYLFESQPHISKKENNFTLYSNPFLSTITVDYNLENAESINITCFDTKGIQINQYKKEHNRAGLHSTMISTGDWPSGIYYIRLSTETQSIVTKMIKM